MRSRARTRSRGRRGCGSCRAILLSSARGEHLGPADLLRHRRKLDALAGAESNADRDLFEVERLAEAVLEIPLVRSGEELRVVHEEHERGRVHADLRAVEELR